MEALALEIMAAPAPAPALVLVALVSIIIELITFHILNLFTDNFFSPFSFNRLYYNCKFWINGNRLNWYVIEMYLYMFSIYESKLNLLFQLLQHHLAPLQPMRPQPLHLLTLLLQPNQQLLQPNQQLLQPLQQLLQHKFCEIL